jgi:chaperonin cofactor prefoldin
MYNKEAELKAKEEMLNQREKMLNEQMATVMSKFSNMPIVENTAKVETTE